LLLNIAQFALLAVLGFLPLIIVHWADHRPVMRRPRVPRAALRTAVAVKTSALIGLTDWLLSIAF